MVEIAKCRMCGGNPRAKIVRKEAVRPHYLNCTNLDCGVDGPMRPTEAEAIRAWNALMAPTPAPEPAAGTVRVPVQIAAVVREMQEPWGNGSRTIHAFIHTALANDGTMWIRNWDNGDGVWVQLNPLPQPPEVPGTVESGS